MILSEQAGKRESLKSVLKWTLKGCLTGVNHLTWMLLPLMLVENIDEAKHNVCIILEQELVSIVPAAP